MIALWLALGSASAVDVPSWEVKQLAAVAGWSTGLFSDTQVSLSAPMTRSDSMVFQATYMRAGLRVAGSPAFAEFGPRIALAPIDVFDVEAHVMAVNWFSPIYGLMPFEAAVDTLQDDRLARDEGLRSWGLVAMVNPTAKIKVGPLIVVDTFVWRHLRIPRPEGETRDFTYEPYDDMVIGWTDHTFDHQVMALWEFTHDDEGESVRIGLTWRDRWAHASGHRSMTAGLMAVVRPGKPPAVPTCVLYVTPYLKHPDRDLVPPNITLAGIWNFDGPL